MIPAKPKPRKCKVCLQPFVPSRSIMPTCGAIKCQQEFALAHLEKVKAKEAKAERQRIQQRKVALRPLQWHLNRTQDAVNLLRKTQDLMAGLPCISCGCTDPDAWTAGHFIPVGRSSGARFDYANIHLQCHQDNFFEGGRLTDYEARLPTRIGQAEVDRVKSIPHKRTWTREELEVIYQKAKAELRELTKAKG